MRKDQRHLVLSLALAGTVLTSASAPVVANALTLQPNPSAAVDNGSALYKFAPRVVSASIFIKL